LPGTATSQGATKVFIFNLLIFVGGISTTILAMNAITPVQGDPITGCKG
jgi:hypothetical protein